MSQQRIGAIALFASQIVVLAQALSDRVHMLQSSASTSGCFSGISDATMARWSHRALCFAGDTPCADASDMYRMKNRRPRKPAPRLEMNETQKSQLHAQARKHALGDISSRVSWIPKRIGAAHSSRPLRAGARTLPMAQIASQIRHAHSRGPVCRCVCNERLVYRSWKILDYSDAKARLQSVRKILFGSECGP